MLENELFFVCYACLRCFGFGSCLRSSLALDFGIKNQNGQGAKRINQTTQHNNGLEQFSTPPDADRNSALRMSIKMSLIDGD